MVHHGGMHRAIEFYTDPLSVRPDNMSNPQFNITEFDGDHLVWHDKSIEQFDLAALLRNVD